MKYKRRNGKPYSYYKEFREYCFSILGSKCSKCGSEEGLQVDHVNYKTKSFSISKEWVTRTLDEINNELSKCQVLCTNCHKEKTRLELIEIASKQGITHGSFYAWMRLKCTCLLCMHAKDTFNSTRRLKRESLAKQSS